MSGSTQTAHSWRWFNSLPAGIFLRLALAAIVCYMETMSPFVRYVTAAELESDYKHPRRDSYVPPLVMWSVVVAAPCLAAVVGYICSPDRSDISQSLQAVSLALGVNGIFTNSVKLIAGRLRPDFFYRCFPDGAMTADLSCTGDPRTVADGRKSFPSGHSSFSFCSLGFVSIWACGRLGASGRASGARLLVCLAPLYLALVISLSRSCDYHHHWQDILAGSLLGLASAYAGYRQHYPPLDSELAGVPLAVCARAADERAEAKPLLNGARRQSKWI